jgi:hypothetical protein
VTGPQNKSLIKDQLTLVYTQYDEKDLVIIQTTVLVVLSMLVRCYLNNLGNSPDVKLNRFIFSIHLFTLTHLTQVQYHDDDNIRRI